MRLIDADALIESIEHNKGKNSIYAQYVRAYTKGAPTIDAVPVVRCKDCKWFDKMGCAIEIVDETDMPKENDFCSFGERKDDE